MLQRYVLIQQAFWTHQGTKETSQKRSLGSGHLKNEMVSARRAGKKKGEEHHSLRKWYRQKPSVRKATAGLKDSDMSRDQAQLEERAGP